MTFSGILFICSLVVSFAALALRARVTNDTTWAQINNIPSKSHFIVLLRLLHLSVIVKRCKTKSLQYVIVDLHVVFLAVQTIINTTSTLRMSTQVFYI